MRFLTTVRRWLVLGIVGVLFLSAAIAWVYVAFIGKSASGLERIRDAAHHAMVTVLCPLGQDCRVIVTDGSNVELLITVRARHYPEFPDMAFITLTRYVPLRGHEPEEECSVTSADEAAVVVRQWLSDVRRS